MVSSRSRPCGAAATSCSGWCSTRVPIADLSRPMIRSPSQCPGHRPVGGLCWALADLDIVSDEGAAAAGSARTGLAQGPPGSQAGGQFPPECTAALHVQRLVDRLVADPHRLIIGEIDLEPVADLLRAPCHTPAAVLSSSMATPGPGHVRTWDRTALRVGDLPREFVFHVGAQPLVGGEFGLFGSLRGLLGLPLRDRGPVALLVGSGGRVAPQLTRHRGRITPDPARDLPHTMILKMPPSRCPSGGIGLWPQVCSRPWGQHRN